MKPRYEAWPAKYKAGALDWIVREEHPDGRSAQIHCYCYGEARAIVIAEALNAQDATRKPEECHRDAREEALGNPHPVQR